MWRISDFPRNQQFATRRPAHDCRAPHSILAFKPCRRRSRIGQRSQNLPYGVREPLFFLGTVGNDRPLKRNLRNPTNAGRYGHALRCFHFPHEGGAIQILKAQDRCDAEPWISSSWQNSGGKDGRSHGYPSISGSRGRPSAENSNSSEGGRHWFYRGKDRGGFRCVLDVHLMQLLVAAASSENCYPRNLSRMASSRPTAASVAPIKFQSLAPKPRKTSARILFTRASPVESGGIRHSSPKSIKKSSALAPGRISPESSQASMSLRTASRIGQ